MKRYRLIESELNSKKFFDWLVDSSNHQKPVIKIDWDRVNEEFFELDASQMNRCERKVKAYFSNLLANDSSQHKGNSTIKNIGETTRSFKQYRQFFREGGFDWIFGGPNTSYSTPVVTINWDIVEENMYKFSDASKKMYERMVVVYFIKTLEQCVSSYSHFI